MDPRCICGECGMTAQMCRHKQSGPSTTPASTINLPRYLLPDGSKREALNIIAAEHIDKDIKLQMLKGIIIRAQKIQKDKCETCDTVCSGREIRRNLCNYHPTPVGGRQP